MKRFQALLAAIALLSLPARGDTVEVNPFPSGGGGGGSGTVTSVGITAPAAGIGVSGSPVTTSGSITLSLADDLAALEGLATTGLAKRTGASTWGTVTDNSTNWDTAFTDRLKWDGGATGLTAATGRTSLGLGDSATRNVGTTAGTVAAGDDPRFGSGSLQDAYDVGRTIDVTDGSTPVEVSSAGTGTRMTYLHTNSVSRTFEAENGKTIGGGGVSILANQLGAGDNGTAIYAYAEATSSDRTVMGAGAAIVAEANSSSGDSLQLIHNALGGTGRQLAFTDYSQTIGLSMPSAGVTSYNLLLPPVQGTANTFMFNDGAGALGWTDDGTDKIKVMGASDNFVIQSNSANKNGINVYLSSSSNGFDAIFAGTSGSASGSAVYAETDGGADALHAYSSTYVDTATVDGHFLTFENNDNDKISVNIPPTGVTPYNLELPALQGAASSTLVNDGTGKLSWTLIDLQFAFDNGREINIPTGTEWDINATGDGGGSFDIFLDHSDTNTNDGTGFYINWAGIASEYGGAQVIEVAGGTGDALQLIMDNGGATGRNLTLSRGGNGFIGINAPSTSNSYNITVPTAQGAAGAVLANSDGAGQLTWNQVGAITAAPATSTDACTAGAVAYDASFFYVCIATDTWKRTALSTF